MHEDPYRSDQKRIVLGSTLEVTAMHVARFGRWNGMHQVCIIVSCLLSNFTQCFTIGVRLYAQNHCLTIPKNKSISINDPQSHERRANRIRRCARRTSKQKELRKQPAQARPIPTSASHHIRLNIIGLPKQSGQQGSTRRTPSACSQACLPTPS
jgi:hypothetical protein